MTKVHGPFPSYARILSDPHIVTVNTLIMSSDGNSSIIIIQNLVCEI